MNSMVRLMVGMAPVAAATHMYSPIKYMAPVASQVEVGHEWVWFGWALTLLLQRVLSMTGQYEFWSRGSLFTDLSETLCEVSEAISHDQDYRIQSLGGWKSAEE